MSKTVAANVDDALVTELDELARQTGRTRSVLIEQALRSYVNAERGILAKDKPGQITDGVPVATTNRRQALIDALIEGEQSGISSRKVTDILAAIREEAKTSRR